MPTTTVPDQPIPAIGYIRVSLAREEMISPEIQRESILRWAKRTGHRITDWVEDLDKTGRNFRRKIMGVIERVEAGEVRVIAVWKYSRFGRNRVDGPANLARVEGVGGQLISATEEVDARTAVGRLQRGMIMEFDAFQSDAAGEQWMETHELRRSQGLPATGGKRFGYTWYQRKIYAPDGTITLQRERYEPDPETRDIAAQLYTDYIAGTGFNTLTQQLNMQGIPNAQGNPWGSKGLSAWMDSGFAAGYLRVHDPACQVKPYDTRCPAHTLVRHEENGHPPIISQELWEQYRARRDFTKTAAPNSRKARYPLTGLCRHAKCDYAARRSTNGRGFVSYVCDLQRTKGSTVCEGFNASIPATEDYVRKWLATVASDIDTAAKSIPARRKASEPKKPTLEEQTEKARAEVQRLERAISKHMRVYAMNEEEDESGDLEREFMATLSDLKEEKRAAQAKLEATEEGPPEARVARLKAAATPVVKGLLAEWDSLRPERVNVLLRQVISRILLDSGGSVEVVPVWEDVPEGVAK
ncbi:MAG: recombinase family protein [Streptomyces sp.]|nr:recombinase family protein [Streptomyces sp.]NUS24399.1 recombinase family protein [Streptomyces sp.]